MFRFFRTLRHRLLAENRVSRYFLYALGEIVLVVIGILLALQINNWNEDRKARGVADEYIERLIREIARDTSNIHDALLMRHRTIANIESYFESYDTTVTSIEEAIEAAIQVQTDLVRYIPVNYTLEDMKSSGQINLLNPEQQEVLSILANYQETTLLMDEKLMEAYYDQIEWANNYLERRRQVLSNRQDRDLGLKESRGTYKGVFEVFDIEEEPQRLAQGLIHKQNSLVALLVYHRVSANRGLEIIKLSTDAIKSLRPESNEEK